MNWSKCKRLMFLACLISILAACSNTIENSDTKSLSVPLSTSSPSQIKLSVSVDTPTTATIGKPFTLTPAVSGGTAPYTWNIQGKSYWLQLGYNGVLSGVPNASEKTITFMLQAIDKNGARGFKEVTINVVRPPNDHIVIITDTGLQTSILHALGKSEGDIYASDLASLTSLTNCLQPESYARVTELSGLEYCTNLTRLSILGSGQIKDLKPLANLTNLLYLSLIQNQISDLTPLANLTNLNDLSLYSNHVSDLRPLANLTYLRAIELSYNHISDLAPLSGLTNLRTLEIHDNQISDLSPLSSMKTNLGSNLEHLDLAHNKISDLSPLSDLTNLWQLNLAFNQVSDLKPLANLTKLSNLYLSSNKIRDVTALAGLPKLEELFLENNQISNLTPLIGLTSLYGLSLNSNQISDLTPLVKNTGLGMHDAINLQGNPLSPTSITSDIPILKAKGISVVFP